MRHRSLALAILLTLFAFSVAEPVHSYEPRAGAWAASVAGGILGNTPDGTAFAGNLNAERSFTESFSLGPLLQVAATSEGYQFGVSGQAKFWMDLHLADTPTKLTLEAGGGFLHANWVTSGTSWLVPLGIGIDYPLARKFSVISTLLLNFTHIDAGLGQGTHLMPGITVGIRF